jgi:hypothetical protein
MHPDTTKALQLYNDGIGTNEIAVRLHRHRSTIQEWLKKSSVKLRKGSPRHKYDVHFFSKYTPESCYWAGFIMADGCIRRTCLHIKLANKDQAHLQKFLDCIHANYEIKGTNYSTVDISGPWFLADLQNNFGIGPRKTFTTTYPNIPSDMDTHFIRGVLDGDGCVTKTTCPTVNFIGSESLMTTLTHKFKALGVRLKSGNEYPPLQRGNKNIAHIHYSGKNAKLILDWLYSDSRASLRLDRKHSRYKELFLI